jgi:hypothetical protein
VTLCPNCHAEVHANIRDLKKDIYYTFDDLYEKFQEFKRKESRRLDETRVVKNGRNL